MKGMNLKFNAETKQAQKELVRAGNKIAELNRLNNNNQVGGEVGRIQKNTRGIVIGGERSLPNETYLQKMQREQFERSGDADALSRFKDFN